MVIECTDKKVANQVQGVLLKYGVRSRQKGPHIGDTTISVMSIGDVPSKDDADVRRDLQRIDGAKIAP
jgi:hypothetical protein